MKVKKIFMKKLIALGLMVVMILSLAACGASAPKEMELKEFDVSISMSCDFPRGRFELTGYSLDGVRTADKKLVDNGLFVYGTYTNLFTSTASLSATFIKIEALQHGKVLETFAPLLPEANKNLPGGFESSFTTVDPNVSYLVGQGFRLEDSSPVTVRLSNTTRKSKEFIIYPDDKNKDDGK